MLKGKYNLSTQLYDFNTYETAKLDKNIQVL